MRPSLYDAADGPHVLLCVLCLLYDAWVMPATLLAAARRMPCVYSKALKWVDLAAVLGRLLFDTVLKPEPPPEPSKLGSLAELLR